MVEDAPGVYVNNAPNDKAHLGSELQMAVARPLFIWTASDQRCCVNLLGTRVALGALCGLVFTEHKLNHITETSSQKDRTTQGVAYRGMCTPVLASSLWTLR